MCGCVVYVSVHVKVVNVKIGCDSSPMLCESSCESSLCGCS